MSTADICDFKSSSLKKNCAFLFLFFIFFGNVFGQDGVTISTTESNPTQNQNISLNIKFDQPVNFFEVNDLQVTNGSITNFNIETPEYNWLTSYNVDQFNIGVGDAGNPEAKTNRIIISVASNSKGEIFVLTFGNGIYRINPNGSKTQITNGSNLESPLDFAINKSDKFFVADNGQARQIKVFSPMGVYLPDENIGNGTAGNSKNNFYGPVGLTFDNDDNLYVADSYSGSDTSEFDRYSIKIYYSNGNYVRLVRDAEANKEIFNPYRVAVDNTGNIYVSDSGGENGRVIVFGPDLKYIDTLEGVSDNLGSPGSIVIDDYGYIYIADLGDEVSITQLLNAEDDPEELLDVFPLIRDGIKNDDFDVNVYDSNRNFLRSISEKIDLPVDLGLDPCGKLLVNNAIFDGKITVVFGFPIPDIDLDFDIEVYNRLPQTFTANLEITEECIPAKVQIGSGVSNDVGCNPNSSGEFQIVWDKTIPIAKCVDSFQIPLVNGSASITVDDINDGSTDNCGIAETSLSQDTFTTADVYDVVMTILDNAGNIDTCEVQVTVIGEEEPTLDISCIGSKIIELKDDQAVDVSAEDFITSDTSGLTFNPTSFQFDCSDIGTQNITITATDDETGATDSCTVEFTVKDTGDPTIICPTETLTRSFPEGEAYVVENFFESRVFDNCTATEDLQLTQDPQVGTVLDEPGIYNIELIAKDNFNKTENCTIKIDLSEEAGPSFDCPSSDDFEPIPLNETCDYEVPDYRRSIRNPQNFEDLRVIQSNDKQEDFVAVTLEVYDGDEFIGDCMFNVPVIDDTAPEILNCSGLGDEVMITEGDTYPLDDYTDDIELNDNCNSNLSYNQNPVAGTPITETNEVTITVTDDSGKSDACTFVVEVTVVEENELVLRCPDEYIIFADEACDYTVPDFSEILDYNPASARIEQSIEAGTNIQSDSEIEITAIYEDQTETCQFSLILEDNIDPTIFCIENQMETVPDGEVYILPDYRNQIQTDDNCGITEVIQDPNPGTEITGNTEISFLVFDQAGNSANCSFSINVSNGTNQPPVARDDNYETSFGVTQTVSPQLGVLNNDVDPDGDDLTAELQDSPGNGSVVLNPDGSFSYTPNQGFAGEDSFTYIAIDGDGEFDEATVFIEVISHNDNNIVCVEEFVLDLDPNGMAVLEFEDLYSGDDNGLSFNLDKSEFNCDDIGENTVRLSYSGNGTDDFCDIQVFVQDATPPSLEVRNISISLNENGTAAITAEDVVASVLDNCSLNPEISLSTTNFSCKDIGENSIQVSAKDEKDNQVIENVVVTVTALPGSCDVPSLDDEYIFIYPNPNTGSFKVETPSDVRIERLEVFDNRGRFIAAKNYEVADTEYAMDLGPLQEAIYVLKIVTNERTLTKRFIFKY